MKLLFVHENLGALGGAEASILLTANELRKRGHSLALLYCSGTGKAEDQWRQTFSPCLELLASDGPGMVSDTIESLNLDLIYLHNFSNIEALEELMDCGVPVVRMVHDHSMYCMRTYKYNYFSRKICHRPLSPYCIFPCLAALGRNHRGTFPVQWNSYAAKKRELEANKRASAFTVYSEYIKAELVRNGFEAEKIHVQVPLKSWSSDGATSSFSERNLILFVGQIIRGKGVDLLLKALARLRVPFECAILGDGNHRAYCERLAAKLGLSDRVHFRGYVPPDELRQYYLEASVLAVSSVWPEPYGLVGPEAMRYGLPIVAFDAGGISEWLSDWENGFLVPWMDTKVYAARLEQLLQDKTQAREMGRRGMEWVNREMEASHQAAKLETMFEQMLPPKQRPLGLSEITRINEPTLACI